MKKPYELYFGCKVGDRDKSWAPRSSCSRCSWYLRGWLISTHQSLPFAVPMLWKEHKHHLTDCYCCLAKIDAHNSGSKRTIVYPNIPSALWPVVHDGSLPVAKPPQQLTLHEEELTNTYPEHEPGPSCSSVHPDFPERIVPHLISQSELNDLVRHRSLSKIQAEHLAPRLHGGNFLQQVFSVYRQRQQSLLSFLSKNGELIL